MGYRYPQGRRAKIHRTYTVDDLSRVLKIHKNTIRNWLRHGLEAIDGRRPTLIRGEALRRFLDQRRTRSKQACGPGRIYCVACRAPKVPAAKMADCIQTSESAGTLQAICPDCNRMIYRRVNPKKLDLIRGDLAVIVTQARSSIEETDKRNVDCDSSKGDH
jgi:Helix-turn-helix domain